MDDLPTTEFGFPGPLRDRLVAAIVSGAKTSTTSLLIEYERGHDELPAIGARQVVIDSAGNPVAAIETTSVRVVRLGDIDPAHCQDEGEGFTSVSEWRTGHESFWHSPEFRHYLGDPDFAVDDTTLVVAERFGLVETGG